MTNLLKCIAAISLLIVVNAYSATAFVGMENSKYGYAGVKFREKFGMVVEHSLWIQDASQYVRLNPFYCFYLSENILGTYSIFAGTTYEKNYYDYGGELKMQFSLGNRFTLSGRFRPQYDSDLGLNYGYEVDAKFFVMDEVALFVGEKSIPEFRAAEDRIFGGLIFAVDNLHVSPQVSIPVSMDFQYTRVHVNFEYELSF